MHKVLIILCLYIIMPSAARIFAQSNVNKSAGIGFRVDDNHSASNFSDYANVFRKYGYNFTFALNLSDYQMAGWPGLVDTVKNLIRDGNEMADHTPGHNTKYFIVSNTAPFTDIAGVDHIIQSSKTICLSYGDVTTTSYTGEGLINVSGDRVISVNPGEFQIMGSQNTIYFNNKLYTYYPENIITSTTKPDTIKGLMSFWGEPINLPAMSNLHYEKIGDYDIRMTDSAIKLMAKTTQDFCSSHGLPNPVSWIQPGGLFPQLWKEDIAGPLRSMGYINGATYPNAVEKFFNEPNPNNANQFGIEWGDFLEDQKYLPIVKNIIANRIAQHMVAIGHSHFWDLLGGWNGYITRMDSLLSWCKTNNIPIYTYSQWSDILNNTPQNPYCNIIPRLDVDLDGNTIPDGYSISSGTTIDNTDFPAGSIVHRSLVQTSANQFFQIDNLGGLEKGENYFSFYAKGQPNSEIYITFWIRTGSTSGVWLSSKFVLTSTSWQKFEMKDAVYGSQQLIIPDSAYSMQLKIFCSNYASGSTYIKIGGMELRKFSTGTIVPAFLKKTDFINQVNNVSWVLNSTNQTSLKLQRKFGAQATYKTVAIMGPILTSFMDSLTDMPDSMRRYDTVSVYYRLMCKNATDSVLSNIDAIVVPTASVLPVELQDFSASTADNKIFLKWNTVTEIQNYGFDVEKETKGEWKKIGFVKGNGNSNSLKKYTFTDTDLSGSSRLAYRLKQIDFDGRYNYSPVVEVNAVPDKFELLQNYPNPFNPATKIAYSIPKAGIVTLTVYNILGEKVSQLINEYKEPGRYKYELNAGHSGLFSSGIYFYSLKLNSNILTKKMLLIK